jgi:hypothetical protein
VIVDAGVKEEDTEEDKDVNAGGSVTGLGYL